MAVGDLLIERCVFCGRLAVLFWPSCTHGHIAACRDCLAKMLGHDEDGKLYSSKRRVEAEGV